MIKIQLNDKALMEVVRLSGPDFILELQNSVIQNFAGKYLKAIANRTIMDESVKVVKIFAKNLVEENIGVISGYGSSSKVKLDERIVGELRKNVSEMIDRDVATIINEEMAKIDILKAIDEVIEKRVDEKLRDIFIDKKTK